MTHNLCQGCTQQYHYSTSLGSDTCTCQCHHPEILDIVGLSKLIIGEEQP